MGKKVLILSTNPRKGGNTAAVGTIQGSPALEKAFQAGKARR